MAKKRPTQVYQVAGVYVLGRSPKGALSAARAHGVAVPRGDLPRPAPAERAGQAINAPEQKETV